MVSTVLLLWILTNICLGLKTRSVRFRLKTTALFDRNNHRSDGDVTRRRVLSLVTGTLAFQCLEVTRQSAQSFVTELKEREDIITTLFETATPSVAYISTFLERQDMFSRDAIEERLGTGSGIVWDREGELSDNALIRVCPACRNSLRLIRTGQGHIVTNFHVIRNSQAAQITLIDSAGKKSQFQAKLCGYDADKDIAVLKVSKFAVSFGLVFRAFSSRQLQW
jgi:S1-C subfamily serine protease